LLTATSEISEVRLVRLLMMGKISIDGSTKPVRGVLPVAADDGLYM
jgi:predicted ATPase with chaperone activity